MLQVLDDGRLTDGQGRTVDFRNTVIVMTSNLGSEEIQALSSKPDSEENKYEDMKNTVLNIVSGHFRPEFINRIDDIVVFHALQKEEVRKIANIQINHLRKRLEELDLQLQISTAALDLLGNAGFDPVYGARPLKRAIQNQLETPLAQEILSGNFAAGETITIDAKNGVFVFND